MLVENRSRMQSLQSLDQLLLGIAAASERFDQGRHAEVKPLADHLSALLHHGEGPDVLLGLRDEITWVDTAGVPNPKTTCSTAGLTLMRIRGRHQVSGEFIPKLSMYPPVPIRTRSGDQIFSGSRIPFEHWWTNPVVKDVDGAQYSRKQLVLALSDHRDPEAEAAHDSLEGSPSLGWVVGAVPAERPLCCNPVTASVRQIGYEVLQSISQQRDVIEAAA